MAPRDPKDQRCETCYYWEGRRTEVGVTCPAPGRLGMCIMPVPEWVQRDSGRRSTRMMLHEEGKTCPCWMDMDQPWMKEP
jgi:hypothetical protein